jgi:hypothetical protein
MIGYAISFFWLWSYNTVLGFNRTTPKPTPYYHLRLITPRAVIAEKVIIDKKYLRIT